MATFVFSNGQITGATITVPSSTFGGQPLTIVIQNNFVPGTSTLMSNGDFAGFVHDIQAYVQDPRIQDQLGGIVGQIPAQPVPLSGGGVIDAPGNTIVMNVGPDVSTTGPNFNNNPKTTGTTFPTFDPITGLLTSVTIDINTTNTSNAFLPQAQPWDPTMPLLGPEGPVLIPVYADSTAEKELGNTVAIGNPTINISLPPGDQNYSPNLPGVFGGVDTNPNKLWGNTGFANSASAAAPDLQRAQENFGDVDQNIGRSLSGLPPRQVSNGQDLGSNVPGNPQPTHSILSPQSPHVIDSPTAPLPPWIESALIAWNAGQQQGSPLVLDLSPNGTGIQLAAPTSPGAVYWNIANESVAHASGWVTGDTGLLCLPNADGSVTSSANLFGNGLPPTYTLTLGDASSNGFQKLAAYDVNHDGVINASDPIFNSLRVWVPSAGSNGVALPQDLHSLSQLGITSINLNYANVSYQIAGNSIEEQSTFTMNGQTKTIADAWFTYDTTNSVYAQPYTLNPAALLLPDQRGYGQLPNLDIAMSNDPTLLSEVQNLAGQTAQQLLSSDTTLSVDIVNLLYQWAGVENADPNPIDATLYANHQHVLFMQQLIDQPFHYFNFNAGYPTGPGPGAAGEFDKSWELAYDFLAAHILGQTAIGQLLGSGVYNLSTDSFSNPIKNEHCAEVLLRYLKLHEKSK